MPAQARQFSRRVTVTCRSGDGDRDRRGDGDADRRFPGRCGRSAKADPHAPDDIGRVRRLRASHRHRALIATCIVLITTLAWAYLVHLNRHMTSPVEGDTMKFESVQAFLRQLSARARAEAS